MSHADGASADQMASRVAVFLRALASRAETDLALASAIAACLQESGLLTSGAGAREAAVAPRSRRGGKEGATSAAASGGAILDPFALWRAQGEIALRLALEEQPLASLRAIVRAHRLDPARVSARWTAKERVAALIFDQVRARMRHGRAFERV